MGLMGWYYAKLIEIPIIEPLNQMNLFSGLAPGKKVDMNHESVSLGCSTAPKKFARPVRWILLDSNTVAVEKRNKTSKISSLCWTENIKLHLVILENELFEKI